MSQLYSTELKGLQFEPESFFSRLDGIQTYDHCDSGANAPPLSYKARWELG